MSKETLNPLLSAQAQVKKACDALGANPAVYELLKEPQRIIEISIPVKMDDGSIKTFKGYRSAHNDAVGPYKGGIRFHPAVNADEVKALSIWMSIKCQVTGIPYGGGKGGITVDPSELSKRELEQLSRGWVRGMFRYLGEKLDIPAPDVNTNGQIMAWMQDEYNKLAGEQTIGVFTGKPLTYGGSQGRNEATGFGVAVITRETLKAVGMDISKATVAVQGFGNVGKYTVKNIIKLGGKVVAVAEFEKERGAFAVYKAEGFTFEELEAAKAAGSITKAAGAKTITMDEFWALDVDAINPCALENAIKEHEANLIKAKVIAEGANGPVTLEADEILYKKGVVVAPDILANAGGVTVSYFEWVQNLYGYYWTEKEVEEKEERAMVDAFNPIWEMKVAKNVSFRQATYMKSIDRIAKAMEVRGWL
ncbi:MAG: Glu/Leu/Phe/Val dehydrogenase [Fusobacterium gastrosuis]|uniref:Glu/Leu/Phe/Val family dehydrogenase n=1 Tax=Fusobacterium TaxID=848 RepID=UPI001F4F8DC8|nr:MULTISPECIES: Glu/Leu/Phe/Val dehydrogenase [Fusobacterium]MDD7392048.1 Glu/Leu/Phe/Val dehydrogenase [Fusobacteriaceae bacterium]MCI5724780.1 Glu/Leu/Phe/Val dehydrogenase [Fusobacterium sp.]MCI7224355.1 Glu/Leu/Phe/Val dehydrogenase [Fusobacterium sp.]MDD7410235.1 Glu/Leu/Phe/Val dehydrogenase [Fusobacteriaceae bacterium]MDY4010447.1 Glu/Leu/Phe/Val dehydrogenase [Fusobacterium gastrosuis]